MASRKPAKKKKSAKRKFTRSEIKFLLERVRDEVSELLDRDQIVEPPCPELVCGLKHVQMQMMSIIRHTGEGD
ncbi:MAG: hypothetical protein WDM77_14625 [Steroidobacteraceae bacterium]